jgi:hypothetical protein
MTAYVADRWWDWSNVQIPEAQHIDLLDRLEDHLDCDPDEANAIRARSLLNAVRPGTIDPSAPYAEVCRCIAPYLGRDPATTTPTPAEPFTEIVRQFAAVRRRWGLPERGGAA